MQRYEVAILGGGIVGLCLANQIIEHGITKDIVIIDKEKGLGKHTSGRNSGVLHAGVYYKPGTIKARVCVEGKRRLQKWINERDLTFNKCGKIIVPTKEEQDEELNLLKSRAENNGAEVYLWDERNLFDKEPEVRSASGRVLWSPNTAVVNPKEVIEELRKELKQRGVCFQLNKDYETKSDLTKVLKTSTGETLSFGHLFNCTGLHADRIAHQFNVGNNYSLLPFKGMYWQIKQECKIKLKTAVYPVPDLTLPFLGVHFTPSADKQPIVSIGPTATPAWGRENYLGLEGVESSILMRSAGILAKQYILNECSFRRYAHEQAFLNYTPLLVRAAQQLIPKIKGKDIEISKKVAIRPQLYNKEKGCLEDDFLCLQGTNSTHVLNAISPAFTASFALADLILENSGFLTSK